MKLLHVSLPGLVTILAVASLLKAEEPQPQGTQNRVVTYGEMRLVIGQQQHQGRVRLHDLVRRQHFYGVGALAELEGEITIQDGTIHISRVNAAGKLHPVDPKQDDPKAALLVGGYVPAWNEFPIASKVSPEEFDEYVKQAAMRVGLDATQPLLFMIDGKFLDVRVHVINGACPVHARIHNREIPKENRPYEREFPKIRGTVIGVYAQDTVGKLTHPSTSTHCHLIFEDPDTGVKLTGHLERVGIQKQGTLKLPKW